MKHNKPSLCVASLIFIIIFYRDAQANKENNAFMCTGIRLIAHNGAVVYGRTMEFAKNIESNILIIPRNYSYTATTPVGKPGLTWKSNYAVVGINVLRGVQFVDGVNERGLAGGLFYFSDYAEYQDVAPDELKNSIAPADLLTWILTSFATVEEVKKALPTIKVSKTVFAPWGFIPPLHAVVHDASGKTLVIEYVKGKLTLYDNPLGVITNSPTFDWHSTNLKNYSALFGTITHKEVASCLESTVPISHAAGKLGLPGDFSSTSRFVRAAYFTQSIMPPENEDATRDVVFHILNLFDIPVGMERTIKGCNDLYDYTQWTSVSDLRNKRYYFHTYENRQIQSIDLMKCDLMAKEPRVIPMKRKQNIVDLTPVT